MSQLCADLAIISNWVGGETRDNDEVAGRHAKSAEVTQSTVLEKDS